MIDFVEVLFTVFSLVLFAVPGYIIVKTKLISQDGANVLSGIVLYVCQTCMVFMAFQSYEYNADISLNLLYTALLASAVHLIMIFLGAVFIKSDEAKKKCIKYSCVFSNCGFMGVPFLKMLFTGPIQGEILIYTAVVLSVFNIFNWTFGVYIMTKDRKQVSIKKILLNPVIIAVVLGFLSFVIFKKPIRDLSTNEVLDSFLEKLMSCIDLLGDAVTPLSMMVIGIKLANINLKDLFTDKLVYLACGLKLILMSFISILVVAFLPIATTVKYVVFFTLSMPAATSTTLFAVKFNTDADFGAKVVLLSTILSVGTIPLMYLVMSGIFGVVI